MQAGSPKILVIRRDNIGDLACTTPLIRGLRESFPDAYLAALVNSYNVGVLRGNPSLDAVFSYTKLKHRAQGQSALGIVFERLRLIRALRAQGFDYALLAKSGFDPHGLRFARQVGARHVIGFVDARNDQSEAIDLPVPPADSQLCHEVEVLARLAQPLDIVSPLGPLEVYPDASRVETLHAQIAAAGSGRAQVALHISAREDSRQWPAEKWIELIRRLEDRGDLAFALFWSPGPADDPRHPGDDDKAERILAAAASAHLIGLPTHSVDELIAALAACDFFIGSDGGAMHLAVALGKPMVTLFENSERKTRHWYPWRVEHELVAPHTFAVGDIEVRQVEEAFTQLLAKTRPA